MKVRNYFYLTIAFVVGLSLSAVITSVNALTLSEEKIIVDDQLSAIKYTGMYQPVYDALVQVYTYEKICKGFYTVEDNGIIRSYTGFGDLADQYTYNEPTYKIIEPIASSTDEKTIVDPIIVP